MESRAPPSILPTGGKRYIVTPEHSHISYMGWTFFYSWTRDTGLSFWDIRYLDSSILYEMSVQEASASYSKPDDPGAMGSQFLDRYWGLGELATSLLQGYDCPFGSTFLETTLVLGDSLIRRPDSICVFEMDLGRPMVRHSDDSSYRAVRGSALVVRWIATVGWCSFTAVLSCDADVAIPGNYDYQFDTIFHPTGSIELEVRASGFLLARSAANNAADMFGE
jgi:primary-amine oxidase